MRFLRQNRPNEQYLFPRSALLRYQLDGNGKWSQKTGQWSFAQHDVEEQPSNDPRNVNSSPYE